MALKQTLDFLRTEAAAGALLAVAAMAALGVANSTLSAAYFAWLESEHLFQAGPLLLRLSVSEWIKDGLMAVFFLVIGLEIKYEILKGELSNPRKLVTPVVAAAGGMAVPAWVYLAVADRLGGPDMGWPIPLATDIAFALAILALFGRGLPSSLRVFLLTLAIVDDLGAIALIAILFTEGVNGLLVASAAGVIAGLAVLARGRLPAPVWVLAFGVVWWLSVRAGLSTSLAAVVFALVVPVQPRADDGQSPLTEAMHDLHPWVAYLVLPLFAFAKAGVSFVGLSVDQLMAPLVLCIAAGLFLGKQIGVFGAAWLVSLLRLGARPDQTTWLQIYGVSLLCGVGFTMSLFIGDLAFPGPADSPGQIQVKLGVILGSVLSGLAGATVLAFASGRARRHHALEP